MFPLERERSSAGNEDTIYVKQMSNIMLLDNNVQQNEYEKQKAIK